jgi:phosphoribosylformylglycinamidine synthase
MPAGQVFVEKRQGFDIEARGLRDDIAVFLGPKYPALANMTLRLFNRYQVEGLDDEQFRKAVQLVFSEPQCDQVFFTQDAVRILHDTVCFGIEYLPGQYDQKADSAEQCVELAVGKKPRIRCAKIYVVEAKEALSAEALRAVQDYLVNPVDSRLVEDPFFLPPSLGQSTAEAAEIPVLSGFIKRTEKGLAKFGADYGLAMSGADLLCCRDYFAAEKRDPTLTELRVLDTYWSDHCRHTTFTTILESIDIDSDSHNNALKNALALYEETRRELYGEAAIKHPRTLMDMATIGARALKKRGLLKDLDESKEINACTIKVKAKFETDKGVVEEPWLLLFKNETHNHPTEIEPFGGAATCLGGAIRDPLSGRAYVHQAMRITGGADPRRPLEETLPGKLPQVKIAREAAAGYSSYGNQIGLTTGQVAEFYHNGYLAKRLELGAVVGAVPEAHVRRAAPARGDLVLLIGGKTGRDGIGGATGSSKIHTGESVESAGAEVQKGNAVEERKLQRLFRKSEVSLLIKRCNDFGAGGVSVAVGELAPGLDINLDAAPKKYDGLDGTELAISESQERMAVVVSPEDAETIIRQAAAENLDAVVIAQVSCGENAINDSPVNTDAGARLQMSWRGKTIVDLSRRFLDSNGASRSARAVIGKPSPDSTDGPDKGLSVPPASPQVALDQLARELNSLRSGSRRGLQERFDGSIGAASVLFPWGGKEQGTPECGMAALLPAAVSGSPAASLSASLMSFGFDPVLTKTNPYEGAKGAVKEALAKFACLGGNPWNARLSMQEYFERMQNDESWGKPAAALLGALEAQLALGVPAIGGKDSMSGSYRAYFAGRSEGSPPDMLNGVDLAVPPTIVVFAAGLADAAAVRSGTLSGKPGNSVILLYGGSETAEDAAQTGEWTVFKANMNGLAALAERRLVAAAYPVSAGGTAAALALMAFGNMTGIEAALDALKCTGEKNYPGAVLAELDGEALKNSGLDLANLLKDARWTEAAHTITEPVFRIVSGSAAMDGGRGIGHGWHQHRLSSELSLAELRRAYEYPLSQVYPQTSDGRTVAEPALSGESWQTACFTPGKKTKNSVHKPAIKSSHAHPLAVLPIFPGTNCEWDMERAFKKAGARTCPVIFRNRNAGDIAESIKELADAIAAAQIVAFSGGFSAGDEPDGSGKFIANVLRSPVIAGAVNDFLDKRGGLMLGICNGFQALIKLGLVPYGKYREDWNLNDGKNSHPPTLTFNRIGRHVSRMVRTRVMSTSSPWLALEEMDAFHILPVSHGEGRLVISEGEAGELFKAGQVPFCYADGEGRPALSEPDNPNGSDFAIEGLTSPDGRILGKMGHSERCGEFVHINIPGNKTQKIFEAGVQYFV